MFVIFDVSCDSFPSSKFYFIYCAAGLSYGTDEMSLREAFTQYGEVVEGIYFLSSLPFLGSLALVIS